MRPLTSVPSPTSGAGRGHHHENVDFLPQVTSIAPLECFLTTEASLESEHDYSTPSQSVPYQSQKKKSTSLNSTISPVDSSQMQQAQYSTPSMSPSEEHVSSRPSTPAFPGFLGPGSLNSIPSSPGDLSSASMSEEPYSLSVSFSDLPPSHSPLPPASLATVRSPIPQLVMPSLTVPQRRPFSDVGRSLGKLKVLVTGQAGIGKTSIIFSIGQLSTHIVHMDTADISSDDEPTHIFASTRPKPWWSVDYDRDMSRRRSSSTVDEVLDRNLCFVDCQGHSDNCQVSQPALKYVESQLAQLCHKPISEPDLCALLSSGAESNVDVVLYLLPYTGPTRHDMSCIREMQNATNVIPVLARADELSTDELILAKDHILQCFDAADLEYFSFSTPETILKAPQIYAISNATHPDRETIDASILMRSDYLPPLVSTDLDGLVEKILSLDGSTWLRHLAASKATKWVTRRRQSGSFQVALSCRQMSTSAGLVPFHRASRFRDYQYWARLEMSSWAEGLRQSLVAERLDMSRRLTTQSISTRMPLSIAKLKNSTPEITSKRRLIPKKTSHQDPLGLLELVSRVQTGGKLTLELLSSLGVLGCVATWIVRPELIRQWDVRFPPCVCFV